MEKSKIVVKRWRVYVRRLMDGLRKPFSTLRLKIRSIGEPGKSRIKILTKLPPGKDGGPSVPPNVSRRELRIKTQPAKAESVDLIADPPRATNRDMRRKKSTARKSISVIGGTEICNACKEPLDNSEDLASCSVEPGHRLHRACVSLMKHKCPYCGNHVN